MASKSKPSGTQRNRRNTSQAKKPATIDLDAKEVKADAKDAVKSTAASTTSATKATSDAKTEARQFGRPSASTKPDETVKENDKSTAAKTASDSKTAETKSTPASKETAKPASKADPKPASAPAPAAKSSGSFFGKLTSAFMGGVAALVGFGAIGLWEGARELPIIGSFYGGTQSTSEAADIEALKAEIATLKQEVANPKIDLSPINQKLEILETNIATVSSATDALADTSEIDGKIASLQEEFAGVNTTVTSMNNAVAEMTASATDGNNSSPVALSAAITALDTRLEKLEADTASIAKSVAKNPALDAINSSIETIEEEIGGIKNSVKEVSQSVSGLQEASKANAETLSGLTQQSEEFEETVASVKAGEKVARSVAVNALGNALENDDALGLPVSSVKSLIGETPEITRLETLVEKGIPSRKELAGSLNAVINTVQNPNAPSESGSIADRFWANAQSMVSFRTSGPQEGDTPLAILSRVKANVEEDALAKAKAEWETLPGDLRESNAAWISKLNARIEAFGLYESLNQKLTAEAG
jgi:hypothetical protein